MTRRGSLLYVAKVSVAALVLSSIAGGHTAKAETTTAAPGQILVAAPSEGACRWCDFRIVCGPNEEARIERKNQKDLADLAALRSMR